ncbi:MAG: hypothetical protein RLZ75_954 [Pseudomonadota bacterium]|jgi:glycosyltransferase involved in cell wall biosynthesis
MKKVCYIATIPAVVNSFLRSHIDAASTKYDVTIICNSADAYLLDNIKARIILLPIERKISVKQDWLILIKLIQLFRSEKFDLIHSIMPKTGLLSMLAAWLTRIPNRVHIFTGQVWATKKGWKREVFKIFDKLIALLATHVLLDSPSQRDFMVSENVLNKNTGIVIEDGSICGIDVNQFHPDKKAFHQVRLDLDIKEEQIVILFLGRLNRDKGMLDLAYAFLTLANIYPDLILVLVGSEEDVSFAHLQEMCSAVKDRIRYVKHTSTPESYMQAADIFCLPSYREGFGQVIIEAAACGIPTVASRIYGITDAVVDKETGLLFTAGDVSELKVSLSTLIENTSLRQQMGNAAQQRVLEVFQSHKITAGMMALYEQLLSNH